MTDLTLSQFASKDDLLAAQAARIAELESQLEAIGAGGVEPLRKQAAAPQAVQAAEPEGWKLAPIKVPDSAFAWVSGGYPAGFKAGDKRDTAVVHERAQRTWEAILDGITAPAHPAEGVPATSVYAEARECTHCNHIGINDSADGMAACKSCQWCGESPEEDKCPYCEAEGTMTASCPKCHNEYSLIASDTLAATQPAAQGMDALGAHGHQERSA